MAHYDVAPLAGYPEDIGILLASLEDSTREWREELGAPTPQQLVWQPYPGGYSIGAVLLHLADAESYWFEQVVLGRQRDPAELALLMSMETDQDAGKWPTPPERTIEEYHAILGKIRARTLASAKHFPPADTVLQHHGNSVTVRWILAHVVEHDSYHGGQAVMLHEIQKRGPSG